MKRDKFKLLKSNDFLPLSPSEKAKMARKATRKVIAGRPFENEADLAEKLEDVIYEYAGILSNATVLDVLEIVTNAIVANMVDDWAGG